MSGRLLSAVLGVSCPQSPIRESRTTSVGVKGILHKICYEVPLHHMATKLVSFSAFSLAFFFPSFFIQPSILTVVVIQNTSCTRDF